MRVLILTPEYEVSGGGIATYYRELAPALRAAGADVRVVEGSGFSAAEGAGSRTLDGVKVERLERTRLDSWVDRFPAFAAMPMLRRQLAASWAMWEQAQGGAGFDIVEAADWGLSFVPPAIEASIPLVVQCHGSIGQIADHDPIADQAADELVARLIERSILSIAAVVQTIVDTNAAFWRTEAGRAVSAFYPAWKPQFRPGAGELGTHGLVVGRLQRWKGPSIVCEALQKLGARGPIIDWCGRDILWASAQTMTSQHLARRYPDLWGTRLRYLGQVNPEEVARLQGKALFNLVPSNWDVFNFTVVEAMASGRPTIVSTGAGASELIADGVNGFLFAAGDADALAAVIERVLREDPEKLAMVSREARRTVSDKLDPGAVARRRIEAYAAAISAHNPGRDRPALGWLGKVCRPSEAAADELAFLNNISLGVLLKHSASRLPKKLRLQ